MFSLDYSLDAEAENCDLPIKPTLARRVLYIYIKIDSLLLNVLLSIVL